MVKIIKLWIPYLFEALNQNQTVKYHGKNGNNVKNNKMVKKL